MKLTCGRNVFGYSSRFHRTHLDEKTSSFSESKLDIRQALAYFQLFENLGSLKRVSYQPKVDTFLSTHEPQASQQFVGDLTGFLCLCRV